MTKPKAGNWVRVVREWEDLPEARRNCALRGAVCLLLNVDRVGSDTFPYNCCILYAPNGLEEGWYDADDPWIDDMHEVEVVSEDEVDRQLMIAALSGHEYLTKEDALEWLETYSRV